MIGEKFDKFMRDLKGVLENVDGVPEIAMVYVVMRKPDGGADIHRAIGVFYDKPALDAFALLYYAHGRALYEFNELWDSFDGGEDHVDENL